MCLLKTFSLIGMAILMGIYIMKRRRNRMIKLMERFEGPPTIPLFGNIFQFAAAPTRAHELLRKENKKYNGRPYRLWYLHCPVIVVHHFKEVSTVFKILRKDGSYECLKDLLGEGLITSSGEKWKRSRSIIEPAFNTHMLSHHIFFILIKHSINLVNELKQKDSKQFDLWPHIFKTSFNSIYDITMGFDENLDDQKVSKFEKNRCSELMIQRFYSPWLYLSFIFKIYSLFKTGEMNPFHTARSLFTESIKRSKKRYMNQKIWGQNENEKKKIIMDILLDAGSFSDDDITDEIVTLLFAGTETNATTVSYTLLMLAQNRNVQEMVHDELDGVFGSSDRFPDASDLSKLAFLEQCIKESLRTTAPPVVIRAAKTDTTLTDGRIVPPGTAYFLSIFDVHHDPDVYPDPYAWNPHHFDRDKVAARSANCFIPFGAGARMCIGSRYAMMAMKVILSTLLRNFQLSTSQTEVTLDFAIVVRVKEGYNVALHPRK